MKISHFVLTAAATVLGAGAALAQDDLYVSDTTSDQITIIQPNGTSNAYGSSSVLSNPTGVAYYDGDVYIADSQTGDITEFNTTSQTFTQFYSGGGLSDPQGLTFDSNGDLFVANSGANNIVEFSAGHDTFSTYASLPTGASPSDLTIDGNGNLFVTEAGKNKIVEALSALPGAVIPFYPPTNGTNPALNDPAGIVFGPGGVYVTNKGAQTVYFVSLTPQGSISISNTTPTPGNLNNPVGDAFNSNGYLFVADNGSNEITEYLRNPSNNGSYTFVENFGSDVHGPSYLTFAPGPAVPEPGTYAMLLGGLAMLYFYQRRRTAAPAKI
jgi:streptogramin lyase